MLDAVTALDGKPIVFKVFQSSLGFFIFYLRLVSRNSLFPNKQKELDT